MSDDRALEEQIDRIKLAAKEVMEAEELVLRFSDDADHRLRLEAAWTAYWDLFKDAEQLNTLEG